MPSTFSDTPGPVPNRYAVGPFWVRFDPDGRPSAFYDLATGEAVA